MRTRTPLHRRHEDQNLGKDREAMKMIRFMIQKSQGQPPFGCIKTYKTSVNNGINMDKHWITYQPQLVSRIFEPWTVWSNNMISHATLLSLAEFLCVLAKDGVNFRNLLASWRRFLKFFHKTMLFLEKILYPLENYHTPPKGTRRIIFKSALEGIC